MANSFALDSCVSLAAPTSFVGHFLFTLPPIAARLGLLALMTGPGGAIIREHHLQPGKAPGGQPHQC
jgi:hypothetical protein